MSFDIPIRVDATGAPATIQSVTSALGKSEEAGVKAGAAIGKAMREGSVATERAKGSADALHTALGPVALAFRSVADGIKREKDMLESIRGPARQHAQDLETLGALYRKDTISAAEYAREVAKVNSSMSKSNGPQARGGLGGVVDNVQSFTSGFADYQAAIAIGQRVVSTAVDIHDALADQETSMSRLTDEYHDNLTVTASMLGLSRQLHSSMAESADLFDAVSDGTERLNYTYEQRLALSSALGAVVRLDNKSLAEAASIMEKLSYAAESGTIETRELKMMMRSLPQLGDIWTKAFSGGDRNKLLELVKLHKVSIDQLLDAATNAGPELTAKLGNLPEKWGVKWDRWKDQSLADIREVQNAQDPSDLLNSAVKRMTGGAGFKENMVSLGEGAANVEAAFTSLLATKTPVKALSDTIADLNSRFHDLAGARAKSVVDGITHSLAEARDKARDFKLAYEQALQAGADSRVLTDLSRGGALAGIDAKNSTVDNGAFLSGIEKARKTTEWLKGDAKAALEDGKISWTEYADAIGMAYDKTDRYGDMLKSIKGPAVDFARDQAILNRLLANGAIGADEYTGKLHALQAAYMGGDWSKLLGGLGTGINDNKRAAIPSEVTGDYASSSALLDRQGQHDLEVAEKMRELEKQSLQDRANAGPSLDAELAADDKRIAKTKELRDLHREHVNDAMRYAGQISDALVEAANGGKVAWGDLFRSMIIDFEKAIVKALLLRAITKLIDPGGGASAASGGANVGLIGGIVSQVAGALPTGSGARTYGGTPSEHPNYVIATGAGTSTPHHPERAAPNVSVNIIDNPRALTNHLNTGEGVRQLARVQRMNPALGRMNGRL